MQRNGMAVGLLAVLTVLGVAGARGADQVALLISPAAYGELSQEIKRYKEEVEARFPAKIHIVEGSCSSPDEVRAVIKEPGDIVSGILFIGNLFLRITSLASSEV